MSLSVIVPAFNSSRFLRQAVLSLLAEDLPNLEIIVIDDASTDGCLETIADLPVKKLRLDLNGGPAVARNAGLRVARGEKIAFLDSDDVLEPEGLRWRDQWLDSNPDELGVMGAIFLWIDETGRERAFLPDFKAIHEKIPSRITWDYFQQVGAIPAPVTPSMFRAEVFRDRIGLFDESLRWAEDTDFICRFLKQSSMAHFCRPVFRYRVHGSNTSVIEKKGFLSGPRQSEAQRILVEMSHGTLKRPPTV